MIAILCKRGGTYSVTAKYQGRSITRIKILKNHSATTGSVVLQWYSSGIPVVIDR